MKEFMVHFICGLCLVSLAIGTILIVMDADIVKGAGFGMGVAFLISFCSYLWYCGEAD
jgi:hypothetical protein